MVFAEKLITKYKNIDVPLKASAWSMICNFLQKGIGFISMPIFSRLLTTEEYGSYTIFFSWINIMTVFCTLRISSGALNNGMIHFAEKKDQFLSSIMGLTMCLTIISSAGFQILTRIFPTLVTISEGMIPLLFVYVFCAGIVDLWSSKERFHYRYKALTSISLAASACTPMLGIVAVIVISDHKAEARIISSLIVELILGSVLFFILLRKGECSLFNKQYWTYVLKFNIPLIPHYLSTILLMQCDTVMVSSICGESAVGLYGIAYSIGMLSTIFNTAINSSLLPFTYHSLKDGNISRLKTIVNKIVIFVAAINLGIILLAPEILKIVAAPEYQEAIWVIPPLIASVFFMFLYTILANVEFYYERSGLIAIASVGAAIMNVCLNIVFIKEKGFVGAGYATVISYMILVIFHILNIKLFCKDVIKETVYDFKFVGGLSILFVAASLVCTFFYDKPVLRTASIVILSFLLAGAGYKYIKERNIKG